MNADSTVKLNRLCMVSPIFLLNLWVYLHLAVRSLGFIFTEEWVAWNRHCSTSWCLMKLRIFSPFVEIIWEMLSLKLRQDIWRSGSARCWGPSLTFMFTLNQNILGAVPCNHCMHSLLIRGCATPHPYMSFHTDQRAAAAATTTTPKSGSTKSATGRQACVVAGVKRVRARTSASADCKREVEAQRADAKLAYADAAKSPNGRLSAI